MELKDINIFAGNHNINRCYEICIRGGFKMLLINSEDEDTRLSPFQFQILKEYYKEVITEIPTEAQIFNECTTVGISEILRGGKEESLVDIKERAGANIIQCMDKSLITTLQDSGAALLKTAYERLALQPYEVRIILAIAAVIAKMDDPKTTDIGTQHIAEAIQYRSLDRKYKES